MGKGVNEQHRDKTWIDPRQEFRPSPIQGIGSFARAPIQSGEVVEVIGGRVMTTEELRTFQTTVERYNAIQFDEQLHLVESPEVTAERGGGSLNHSCDSNLWMADEVTLVARRAIAAGEELTVDYALFSGSADTVLERACRCGSRSCRGLITGNDWLLLEVQQRYYPHFSPFINARIERLRRDKS